MTTARPRARTTTLAAGALLLAAAVGVAGCTSSGSTASGASTTSTPSSTPSTTPSPSETTVVAVPAVKGYVYVALPAEFGPTTQSLLQTGLIAGVDGRGVQKTAGGDLVAAVIVAKYRPGIAIETDKVPVATVLDGMANSAKAVAGATAKVTASTIGGVPVRLVQGEALSVLVGYKKGGTVIQVYGPTAANVTAFASGFLPLA